MKTVLIRGLLNVFVEEFGFLLLKFVGFLLFKCSCIKMLFDSVTTNCLPIVFFYCSHIAEKVERVFLSSSFELLVLCVGGDC